MVLVGLVGVLGVAWGCVQAAQGGIPMWLLVPFAAMLLVGIGFYPAVVRWKERLSALAFYLSLFGSVWVLSFSSAAVPASAVWLGLVGAALLAWACSTRLVRIRSVRVGAKWLAASAACGLAIAFLSGPKGGSDPMVRLAMEWFGLTLHEAELAITIVRKCLHFLFFGMLAWFAAQGARKAGATPRHAAMFAIIWGLTHAIFDETRQSFSYGRTGSPWDVALDGLGMVVFTAVYWWPRRGENLLGLRASRAHRP
jgi:VanZ family protein